MGGGSEWKLVELTRSVGGWSSLTNQRVGVGMEMEMEAFDELTRSGGGGEGLGIEALHVALRRRDVGVEATNQRVECGRGAWKLNE